MQTTINEPKTDVSIPKYLRTKDIMRRFNISRMTLWRWINNEKMSFPKPCIGGQGSGSQQRWDLSTVLQWEKQQQKLDDSTNNYA